MNDPVGLVRPVFLVVALLFVAAVVTRVISDAAHDRRRVEMWLQRARLDEFGSNNCHESSLRPATKSRENEAKPCLKDGGKSGGSDP